MKHRDPLDDLLREALYHKRIGEGSIKREKTLHETLHSVYSNPDNWTMGRVIEVIYHDVSGQDSSLGVFREYIHRRSSARKLCHCDSGAVEAVEYVTGEYWMHYDLPQTFAASPDEVSAIRQYLESRKPIPLKPLMKELSADRLIQELAAWKWESIQ